MSSSALMALGLNAMAANYAQLQATGHNIANQSVEGYSRQIVDLATAQGQFTGAGFFGKGVNVVNVTRAHDQFLTMQASVAKSLASMDDARSTQLNQLELVFPTGDQGIGASVGNFLNSMVDLSNNPSDSSARQVVLARASETATRFSSASSQLDTLQAGVNADLASSVATVNSLAQQVAAINQQVAAMHGLDQQPNDLLDQRDQLIKQISSYIQVSTIPAEDGSVGVLVAGGQQLVLGNQAEQMAVSQDPNDTSRSQLGILSNGVLLPLDPSQLSGGSMVGLLRFQNTDLVDARNQLGQMATAFASRVNQVQALGLDLRSPAGSGSPLFSIGAPKAIANAQNARDASGNFVSQPSIAITDATQLQASDYALRTDPNGVPGQYQLTRLSDGFVRTVADGATVDGFQINIGTPAPASTDRYLLQPVAAAAGGMARAMDDPNGIAAASPVTANLGVGNTGTATVASLTVVSPSIDPNQTATFTFTSATGDYSYELRDRTTGALTASGTGTWTAGQPISLNGFELKLNGVPSIGDTVDVSKTVFPASNNGNALNMAALQDEPMVGRTLLPDGTLNGGASITDAYASTMANIGVRVQGATSAAAISASASTQADDANSSVSGVNLDEEAARLIQFQQGYQAAAKVLQVAQSIFDTLLQVAGG